MNTLYIYDERGGIIGKAEINGNFIEDIRIDPEYQGVGYGSRLLNMAEREIAKEHDYGVLQPWGDDILQQWYKKRGWDYEPATEVNPSYKTMADVIADGSSTDTFIEEDGVLKNIINMIKKVR